MYIETWRWRLVIAGLGVILIWSGVYGVFHQDTMMVNICYSATSVFLQRLNTVLSGGAFVVVAAGGGLLEWYVWYSIKRGLAVRDDRKPIDWKNVWVKVVVYALLIGVMIAGIAVVAPKVLKGTTLDPGARQPSSRQP